MSDPSYLTLPTSARIAYHYYAGSVPTVVFLGGFRSDMTGTKALALEEHCKAHNISFLRFDYEGHGQSSGNFDDGSIGLWIQDARAVIESVTEGPLILIGSSMGGWIMLHVALALKQRVIGLLGIAAAPDFPIRLMWEQLTDPQRHLLITQGTLSIPSDYSAEPYVIRHAFIEESRQHMLLDGSIDIRCPVHLLHGMQDKDVPWKMSTQLAKTLTSDEVEITLLKSGDHRLSSPQQIATLLRNLDRMIEKTR